VLARLEDEHAGEGPAPVHHGGGEDGRWGLRAHSSRARAKIGKRTRERTRL
jgi:hypothetical protein